MLWQFVQGRPSTPPCTSGQPARGFNSNKPPLDPRSPRRTDFSQHPQQPARPRSLSMMSSAEASRWSSPTAPKVRLKSLLCAVPADVYLVSRHLWGSRGLL